MENYQHLAHPTVITKVSPVLRLMAQFDLAECHAPPSASQAEVPSLFSLTFLC